ncbi:MAG TPA: hypothetical protein VGB99_09570, partial [Acidobacteriota bacterium]
MSLPELDSGLRRNHDSRATPAARWLFGPRFASFKHHSSAGLSLAHAGQKEKEEKQKTETHRPGP